MFYDMLSDPVLLIKPLVEYLLGNLLIFKCLLFLDSELVQVVWCDPLQVCLSVVQNVIPRD